MPKTLTLVLTGVVALALGVFGTVALASSVTSSPAEAAQNIDESALTTSVYGTR